MREDAVATFLARAGADGAVSHRLVARGLLVKAEYRGHNFYLRKLGQASQRD
jgi:hypothetical protein